MFARGPLWDETWLKYSEQRCLNYVSFIFDMDFHKHFLLHPLQDVPITDKSLRQVAKDM